MGQPRPLPPWSSPATPYGMDRLLRRADAMAVHLRSAMDRLAPSLARAAAAFVEDRGWSLFGYSTMEDHARERFGRTGRWLRDMAALGRGIEKLPELDTALTGADGGQPIGAAAALQIAGIATGQTLGRWVEVARLRALPALREEIERAREAGSAAPVPEPGYGAPPEFPGRRPAASAGSVQVRLALPAPIAEAFDETLELFRAVEGRRAGATRFVEALVAEAAASGLPGGEADGEAPAPAESSERVGFTNRIIEAAMEQMGVRCRHNMKLITLWHMVILVGGEIGEIQQACAIAGEGGPVELDAQIRRLIEYDEQLQIRLGDLLLRMEEAGSFQRLEYAGAAHYAEHRLRVSRTSATDRMRAARGVRALPVLKEAYRFKRLGLEKTLILLRLLQGARDDLAAQKAWVEHARRASVKRLRDELRACGRRRAAGDRAVRLPLSHAEWHASICREPGMTAQRLARLRAAAAAGAGPDVFLRLTLPEELAAALTGAIEAARVRKGASAPPWEGFMALLEDFAATWDDPEGMPRRRNHLIFEQAGYRCVVPGCTCSRNLEDHHILYRSRGGSNARSNRECVCRGHHQHGVHGGLVKVTGTAPLDLIWVLGRDGIGGTWQNEMRLD